MTVLFQSKEVLLQLTVETKRKTLNMKNVMLGNKILVLWLGLKPVKNTHHLLSLSDLQIITAH